MILGKSLNYNPKNEHNFLMYSTYTKKPMIKINDFNACEKNLFLDIKLYCLFMSEYVIVMSTSHALFKIKLPFIDIFLRFRQVWFSFDCL